MELMTELQVVLHETREYLNANAGNGFAHVAHQGKGSGDERDDTVITADLALGRFIQKKLDASGLFGKIWVEESQIPDLVCNPTNPLEAFVDPLDGSLCYKTRGHSQGLPHSAVITVGK
ncbi:MAG: hypothetical protein WCV84_01815, partial [Patescibacteria group bacterium]